MALNGKELVEFVVADLEGFFHPGAGFCVATAFGSEPLKDHAIVRGAGRDARICFSSDFCACEISDGDTFNFMLLVVCHELAHFLHQHNSNTDASSFESRSIEDWADFFGAKLAMTILTYGQRVRLLHDGFAELAHSGRRLDSIGKALSRLAQTFFINESPKYSSRLSRVGYCVAGINSFFDRHFGYIDLKRSYSVMSRIYGAGMLPGLIASESSMFMAEQFDITVIDSIHKRVQDNRSSITPGLLPQYEKYIGTSYVSDDEERRLYVAAVEAEYRRQGMDVSEGEVRIPDGIGAAQSRKSDGK